MIVMYQGKKDILFCSKGKSERRLIKDYFTNGDRNLKDYVRTETDGVILENDGKIDVVNKIVFDTH